MPDRNKVCHFKGVPPQRLLEMYSINYTTTLLTKKEKMIRFWLKLLGARTCELLCGRSSNKTIGFKVEEATFMEEGIWHVKGILQGNRKVILCANTIQDISDVIQKL